MRQRQSGRGRSWLVVGALTFAAGACGSSRGPAPRYDVADRGTDRDGDGAADLDDVCPDDAEDGLSPKANDGCPAADPDVDGVLLGDDRCPDAKEDGEPPNASDGCPMADADADGVADAKDRCPGPLEDNVEPDPSDGCPAPDGDRDGIADSRDRCPAEPESFNGYRDGDGCADSPPAVVVLDTDSSEIYVPEANRIEFEHDSDDLTPAARTTLAEVATVLKARPDIDRVEIEGHASSKGDAAYNVALTERRAQAVARALVKLGIDASRLVPIGYGEHCPVVDRGDDVDDASNRRVALKAVRIAGVWQSVPRGCWRAQTTGINPAKRNAGLPAATPAATPTPTPVVKPVGGA